VVDHRAVLMLRNRHSTTRWCPRGATLSRWPITALGLPSLVQQEESQILLKRFEHNSASLKLAASMMRLMQSSNFWN